MTEIVVKIGTWFLDAYVFFYPNFIKGMPYPCMYQQGGK